MKKIFGKRKHYARGMRGFAYDFYCGKVFEKKAGAFFLDICANFRLLPHPGESNIELIFLLWPVSSPATHTFEREWLLLGSWWWLSGEVGMKTWLFAPWEKQKAPIFSRVDRYKFAECSLWLAQRCHWKRAAKWAMLQVSIECENPRNARSPRGGDPGCSHKISLPFTHVQAALKNATTPYLMTLICINYGRSFYSQTCLRSCAICGLAVKIRYIVWLTVDPERFDLWSCSTEWVKCLAPLPLPSCHMLIGLPYQWVCPLRYLLPTHCLVPF